MRIIAGKAKGRRIRSPVGARPTTDRVRQVVFDLLRLSVRDARVLDLFAGSGALGIEALSRGAREAVFVDSSRDACDLVRQNLDATDLRGQGTIRRADAVRWVARRAREPFDLVFVDPPYERGLGLVARVLGRLATGGWIGPGGTVVVEAPPGVVEWPPGLREVRVRRFGRTQVSVAVHDVEGAREGNLPGDVRPDHQRPH